MKWKGFEIKTYGDMMRHGVEKCDTPEEAQEFMRLYRAENGHADENIGYLSGYYDEDTMQRIQEWFGVTHPIFGTAVPTPEQAFELGKQWVKENK